MRIKSELCFNFNSVKKFYVLWRCSPGSFLLASANIRNEMRNIIHWQYLRRLVRIPLATSPVPCIQPVLLDLTLTSRYAIQILNWSQIFNFVKHTFLRSFIYLAPVCRTMKAWSSQALNNLDSILFAARSMIVSNTTNATHSDVSNSVSSIL